MKHAISIIDLTFRLQSVLFSYCFRKYFQPLHDPIRLGTIIFSVQMTRSFTSTSNANMISMHFRNWICKGFLLSLETYIPFVNMESATRWFTVFLDVSGDRATWNMTLLFGGIIEVSFSNWLPHKASSGMKLGIRW